jgi:hypothetical protein
MKKHFSFGSLLVIALTFILFLAALFTSGFTHDVLLEAGVLLVSIKLIMMSHKNSLSNKVLLLKIDELKKMLIKE